MCFFRSNRWSQNLGIVEDAKGIAFEEEIVIYNIYKGIDMAPRTHEGIGLFGAYSSTDVLLLIRSVGWIIHRVRSHVVTMGNYMSMMSWFCVHCVF